MILPWNITWPPSSHVVAVVIAVGIVLTLIRHATRKPSKTTSWTESPFRFLYGLYYLVRGPEMIDSAYTMANGKSFKVPTPSNDHLLVTSPELIKELIDAPLQQLSLHAVAKEILQPKHTMYGFEWQDKRGVEGTGFVRALRSLLTAHLPEFRPKIEEIISNAVARELSKPEADGFARAPIFPLIKRIVTEVNCFVFFGEELSKNAEFTAAALEFPQSVIFAAEFLRISPECLRPLVAAVTTRRHRAAKTLFRHLEPIVQRRLAARAQAGEPDVPSSGAKNHDCMQWLIDTSPRKDPWSPARMVGEIMAVWFGSVHQLAMTTTYAIQDLCLHSDYVDPLRAEIRHHRESGGGVAGSGLEVDKLPLLDSFVRESIRCTNSDAVTGRRKALVPYEFQDGSWLKTGDWACVPQRPMMRDNSRYSDASVFDGFRFARANSDLLQGLRPTGVPERVPLSLTDANEDWPIWGFGNTACPGRFYASLVMKLILVHILDHWDCKMLDPMAPRSRSWRSSIVPRNGTVVLFKRR